MRHLLPLTASLVILLVQPTRAASPMSPFFQTSASHLVHQHAYYRGGQTGPACTVHTLRDHGCTGRGGVLVWR